MKEDGNGFEILYNHAYKLEDKMTIALRGVKYSVSI